MDNELIEKINEEIKSKMKGIAKKVDDELPTGYGFALLVFNFGESEANELIYASNGNREDVVEAMKEFIEKTKNTYGNDTGKY